MKKMSEMSVKREDEAARPITSMQHYIKIMPEFPKQCKWRDCNVETPTMNDLVRHLITEHVNTLNWGNKQDRSQCVCKWQDCTNKRVFTYEGRMLEHLRVHTLERPYLCPFRGCNSFFTLKSNCVSHIRSRHRKEVDPLHIDFLMQPGHEFHESAPKDRPPNAVFDPFIDEEKSSEKEFHTLSSSSSVMSASPRASRLRDGATDYYNFDLTSNETDSLVEPANHPGMEVGHLHEDVKSIITSLGPPSATENDERGSKDGEFKLPVASRLRQRRRAGDTLIPPLVDTKNTSTAKAKAVANIPRLPNGQFAPRAGSSPRQSESTKSRRRKPARMGEGSTPTTPTFNAGALSRLIVTEKSTQGKSKTLAEINNWKRQMKTYDIHTTQLRKVSRELQSSQQYMESLVISPPVAQKASDPSAQLHPSQNTIALLNAAPFCIDSITTAAQDSTTPSNTAIASAAEQPKKDAAVAPSTAAASTKISCKELRTGSVNLLAEIALLLLDHQKAQSYIRDNVLPSLTRKPDYEMDMDSDTDIYLRARIDTGGNEYHRKKHEHEHGHGNENENETAVKPIEGIEHDDLESTPNSNGDDRTRSEMTRKRKKLQEETPSPTQPQSVSASASASPSASSSKGEGDGDDVAPTRHHHQEKQIAKRIRLFDNPLPPPDVLSSPPRSRHNHSHNHNHGGLQTPPSSSSRSAHTSTSHMFSSPLALAFLSSLEKTVTGEPRPGRHPTAGATTAADSNFTSTSNSTVTRQRDESSLSDVNARYPSDSI